MNIGVAGASSSAVSRSAVGAGGCSRTTAPMVPAKPKLLTTARLTGAFHGYQAGGTPPRYSSP
ncbi:hypothetical protein, partial [Streptomyces alfalfae]